MLAVRTVRLAPTLALFTLAGCSSTPTPATDASPADVAADLAQDVPAAPDVPVGPARAVFDLAADTSASEHFYDRPWPSDLRLLPDNSPDFRGFPSPPRASLVTNVLEGARDRKRFPVLAVGYFRFTAPLASRSPDAVIPADIASPVLLIDVDPASPERGRLLPTVAVALPSDNYLPDYTLAVAARPGFVMHPGRRYAYVVRSSLRDASGAELLPSDAITALRRGEAPAGARGADALALYRPLFETLQTLRVDPATVVAATVFTTATAVADLADLGRRVVDRYDVPIDGLRLAPGDSPSTHPRFCVLQGTMSFPQFQTGQPPFDTEGLFRLDSDGMPTPVTYTTPANYGRVPITLTLPRQPMPAGGYPLVQYFHGSGGVSTANIDRGLWTPVSPTHPCAPGTITMYRGTMGCNALGEGPSHVLAARGIATAGSALPVNPERLPGASTLAYLNFGNLKAMRDTFRQGVLEQRLYLEALGRLRIPADLMAQCTGATLPTGVTEARFDTSRLIAMGQSMGGMYTNLLAATEPQFRAAIPTGAGGFWSYMLLTTEAVMGIAGALRPLLMTENATTFMHPSLATLEYAWEPIEPVLYMPHLAREPLPGHPVRSIYEPVGLGDSYFSSNVYDAMALAYGHPMAGREVWPTMQPALALSGLSGILPYPVRNNRMGPGMTPYTGVIVQYAGDGVFDPHSIYTQLDAVKYQYSCFARTFIDTGVGTVFDPTGRAADAPCQ